MKEKICGKCGVLKIELAFGTCKESSDGLNPYCRECVRKRGKKSYKKLKFENGKHKDNFKMRINNYGFVNHT